jgi:hypothetical protein
MSHLFEEFVCQLEDAEGGDLAETARAITDRIRALPPDERSMLVSTAMKCEFQENGSQPSQWNPRRTLQSLILHTADVPTVSSQQEEELREEIRNALANSTGRARPAEGGSRRC